MEGKTSTEPESSAASAPPVAKVLVVDDDPHIQEILCRWISAEGYECEAVGGAEQALALLESCEHELLLLDIKLPDMSGVELLAQAKDRMPEVAVIMVTGVDDRSTALRCMQLGAHGYLIKPLDETEVLINVYGALEERRRLLRSQAYQHHLEQAVLARTAEIRRREREIALRLVAAAEYRDEETHGHIRRIGMFAEVLARALGWDPQDIDEIRVAASMHDVGKIGIPDGILMKTGKLTPEEFEVVKLHTKIGAEMLADSDIPLLQMAYQIAHSHHEKWDGSGYPQGLEGEQIPQAARIVAVADVYDALTHNRIYRPAYSQERALEIMRKGRAVHFDPQTFDVFLEALPTFKRITEQVADEVP